VLLLHVTRGGAAVRHSGFLTSSKTGTNHTTHPADTDLNSKSPDDDRKQKLEMAALVNGGPLPVEGHRSPTIRHNLEDSPRFFQLFRLRHPELLVGHGWRVGSCSSEWPNGTRKQQRRNYCTDTRLVI